MSSLKLEFLTETLQYLRPVLRETKTGEESAETIIPDSIPDVSEVLSASGMAFLRGRELSEGRAAVAAGISASVLVQPEGQSAPEVIEQYLPISFSFENSLIRPDLKSRVQVTLQRVEGHLVNPRKLLIRASVTVELEIFAPCRETHPTGALTPEVETLTEPRALRLMTAMEEKRYSIEDSIRFEPEGTGRKIAACRTELSHTESRLTGTRAVFRGNLKLSILYLTEDGQLLPATAELPFSQYIDLECEDGEQTLELESALCGLDAGLSADGGSLELSAQIQTRAAVIGTMEPAWVTDLYACAGEAEVQWQELSYESLLDTQLFSVTGRGSSPAGGQPLVAGIMPEAWSQSREGETVRFSIPVRVLLLSREESGWSGSSVCPELTCSTQAAQGCRFDVQVMDLQAEATSGLDGTDVKLTGTVCVRTYGTACIAEPVDGEITERQETDKRPGLIIRRTGSGERIWDIAKGYRTTVEAIRAANDLAGEPERGTLLLIPGR